MVSLADLFENLPSVQARNPMHCRANIGVLHHADFGAGRVLGVGRPGSISAVTLTFTTDVIGDVGASGRWW